MRNDRLSNKEIEHLADELIEWFNEKENIYLKNFAVHKGFPARKISEYANKNKYFEEKLALAKDTQESKLVAKGLSKQVSSNFVMFMLKNTAGWRDRFDDEKKEDKVPLIKLVLKETQIEKINTRSKKNKNQLSIFGDENEEESK